MLRLRAFIIWTVLGCSVCFASASSMTLHLMDDREYAQRIPNQGPLSEQFTALVSSLPNPINTTQNRPVRIALMLFGDVQSLDNQSLLLTFRKRMRELGIDYRLDVHAVDALSEADLSAYYKVAESQPDYIVMTKLGFVQRRFLERFLRSARSKVILYDFASPFKSWMNHSPLMYVGFDQQKATTMLASYLDRQLPAEASISALVLPSGYLSHVRCHVFLDEMVKVGRSIRRIFVVPDDKQQAFLAAQTLLEESPSDFIFTCTQTMSDGVLLALQEKSKDDKSQPLGQTNTWGLPTDGITHLGDKRIKASVLFMKDDLSIAVAEAIKLDIEGKSMPSLYIERSVLMPAGLDAESIRLMVQQAYHYSVELWRK